MTETAPETETPKKVAASRTPEKQQAKEQSAAEARVRNQMQMDPIAKAALMKLLDKVPGSAQIFVENIQEELQSAPAPNAAVVFSPAAPAVFSLASPSGRSVPSPAQSARTPTLSRNQQVPPSEMTDCNERSFDVKADAHDEGHHERPPSEPLDMMTELESNGVGDQLVHRADGTVEVVPI